MTSHKLKQTTSDKFAQQFIDTSKPEVIAEHFLNEHPAYYSPEGIWYIYDPTVRIYRIVDKIDILNSLRYATKMSVAFGPIYGQMERALSMVARDRRPTPLSPTEIQLNHVIYDIETQQTREATSDDFTIGRIPWDLGTTTDTPKIDQLFAEWVGHEHVPLLVEWIAYHLVNAYPIHRVLLMYGSGSNGKSTFVRFLRTVIGTENIGSGEFQSMFTERFGTTQLYEMKGIVCTESDTKTLEKTDRFKAATGGDPIDIEYKHKTKFTYVNTAKITISANIVPPSEDKTDGFYRRFLIVHFPKQFEANIDIKLPTEEIPALLRKCVQILPDLLKRGMFTGEGTISDRRSKYEALAKDQTEEFYKHLCVEDTEQFIPISEFSEHLLQFCRTKKCSVPSDRQVNKTMERLEIKKGVKTLTVRTQEGKQKQARVWVGIRWKTADDDTSAPEDSPLITHPTLFGLPKEVY